MDSNSPFWQVTGVQHDTRPIKLPNFRWNYLSAGHQEKNTATSQLILSTQQRNVMIGLPVFDPALNPRIDRVVDA